MNCAWQLFAGAWRKTSVLSRLASHRGFDLRLAGLMPSETAGGLLMRSCCGLLAVSALCSAKAALLLGNRVCASSHRVQAQRKESPVVTLRPVRHFPRQASRLGNH